jgi:hypothetical protein
VSRALRLPKGHLQARRPPGERLAGTCKRYARPTNAGPAAGVHDPGRLTGPCSSDGRNAYRVRQARRSAGAPSSGGRRDRSTSREAMQGAHPSRSVRTPSGNTNSLSG